MGPGADLYGKQDKGTKTDGAIIQRSRRMSIFDIRNPSNSLLTSVVNPPMFRPVPERSSSLFKRSRNWTHDIMHVSICILYTHYLYFIDKLNCIRKLQSSQLNVNCNYSLVSTRAQHRLSSQQGIQYAHRLYESSRFGNEANTFRIRSAVTISRPTRRIGGSENLISFDAPDPWRLLSYSLTTVTLKDTRARWLVRRIPRHDRKIKRPDIMLCLKTGFRI